MQLILSIGFFLFSIRTILFWTSLWQVKEYRLDRLFAHIKETEQGRKLSFSPYAGIFLLSILGYMVVIFNDTAAFWYHFYVMDLFGILGALFIYEIGLFSFRRPRFTIKAFLISLLSLLFVSVLYMLSLVDIYLWALLIALFIPFSVAIFVALFSFPSEIYTDILIQKARTKIEKLRKLKIIAVSGSYGKSSTKEYLAQILVHNFSIVRTPFSNNTPIGVAKTILNTVNKDTQILIVEMGAYKKGEIEKLCEIVTPDISITTSISDQHLSLYGSVKNVIASEKELLDALPRKGMALMNANSPLIFSLLQQVKRKIFLYGTENEGESYKLHISGSDIKVKKNQVDFTVTLEKEHIPFSAPLLGAHNIENILPAIFIAHKLGMPTEEIQKAVEQLQPLPKTMKKIILQNGATVVDDTFNASPESVSSALAYLQIYPRKKFFVMTPLIELGKNAHKRHVQIGEELSVCTKVFLTNKNFANDIIRGLTAAKAKTQVVVAPSALILEQLNEEVHKGDIIIFEGKEAGKILQELV